MTAELQGIFPVLCTPFTADGAAIDEASLDRLVDFVFVGKCHGLVTGGLASETAKLSAEERREITERVARRVRQKALHIVGTSAETTDDAVHLTEHALVHGAHALMVAPPRALAGDDAAIRAYYLAVARAAGDRFVMIQDNAAAVGYEMSTELLLDLARAHPALCAVKLESPPSGPKATRLLRESGGAIRLFGGLGGQFFLEELARGAAGLLPGAGLPEVFVRIWNAWMSGNRDAAALIYREHMALVRFISQSSDWSHHCYKALLVARGVISNATVRKPTKGIDSIAQAQLLDHARAAGIRVLDL